MSALLNNLSPWIASNLSGTLTFDPTSEPIIDRKPKIVQIVETPQNIAKLPTPTSDEFAVPKVESWVYLVVKDKLHSIPLILPSSIRNVNVCRSKRPDLFQAKGGILTLSNWHVSHVNLLRIPKVNGNVLVLVIEDEEQEGHRSESYSQDVPSLSLQGGEGMNVLPHENVHRSIILRRALKSVSDARIQWRQVLDCYSYTKGLSRESDQKLIPSFRGTLGNPDRLNSEAISQVIEKYDEERNWYECSEDIEQKKMTKTKRPSKAAVRDPSQDTDQFIPSSPHSQEMEIENDYGISDMLDSQTQDSSDDEIDFVKEPALVETDTRKHVFNESNSALSLRSIQHSSPLSESGDNIDHRVQMEKTCERIQNKEPSHHPVIETEEAIVPDTLQENVPGTQLQDETISQESGEYIPGTQLQNETIPHQCENALYFVERGLEGNNHGKSMRDMGRESSGKCAPSEANTVLQTVREADESGNSRESTNLTTMEIHGNNSNDRIFHEYSRITKSKRKYESIASKIKKRRRLRNH